MKYRSVPKLLRLSLARLCIYQNFGSLKINGLRRNKSLSSKSLGPPLKRCRRFWMKIAACLMRKIQQKRHRENIAKGSAAPARLMREPIVLFLWHLRTCLADLCSCESWNGSIPPRKPDLKGMRLRLSLYQLHEILRAFDKPLGQAIENINKFRTHAVDDQIVMHMGQVPKGIAWIRHAALLLDQSIDRFSCDFTQFKRKLSRDKLVSVFVMAIYPNIREETADYKAINRICVSRRKSIRNSVIRRTDGRRDHSRD